MQQAINWTNDGLVYWHTYASLLASMSWKKTLNESHESLQILFIHIEKTEFY